MNVVVLTDSAATLPTEMAQTHGIVVVPSRLSVAGRTLRDGELTLEEILAHVDAGEAVTSSGPTPGDFLDALERSTGQAGALILTVAHRLGASTFESARTAAGLAANPVRVVDSATAAGGQGLIALAAATRARTGATLEEVEARAIEVRDQVRVVASLSRLDYLVKGGHVPSVVGWAGRTIGLRPLIELSEGSVRPLRPALSAEAARDRMLQELWTSQPPAGGLHLAVLHALAGDAASELLAAVRVHVEPVEAFIGTFSTVMVIHSGPDLLGLAWWWENDQVAG
jgi:DegV family protein with EDD domain